jgi:hypothetical protein
MRLRGLRSIRAAKIVDYLLNENHPVGGTKARFFKRFGFDADNPTTFESALLRHPSENEVWKSVETSLGIKSIVVCTLRTPDGRNPCVRTIWFKPIGSTAHRLVSAYPAGDPQP